MSPIPTAAQKSPLESLPSLDIQAVAAKAQPAANFHE